MKTNTGFTLIESLIAVVILSIGIIALTRMQDQSIRGNLVSKHINTSTFLATAEIDRLVNMKNPMDINNDGNAGLNDVGGNADYSDVFTLNGFQYQVSANVSNNDPVNNVRTVNVLVHQGNRQVAQIPYIVRVP